MPSCINSKPKIWAPYMKHKTLDKYKDNIKQVYNNGDTESVNNLKNHLKVIYPGNVDGIVNHWLKQFDKEKVGK